jgi:hypothetical protein
MHSSIFESFRLQCVTTEASMVKASQTAHNCQVMFKASNSTAIQGFSTGSMLSIDPGSMKLSFTA